MTISRLPQPFDNLLKGPVIDMEIKPQPDSFPQRFDLWFLSRLKLRTQIFNHLVHLFLARHPLRLLQAKVLFTLRNLKTSLAA